MLPLSRHHLSGPPFALPAPLDRLSEAWWRTGPRTRVVVASLGVALTALAGVAHAASTPGGPPTAVWVASRDLVPGEVIGAGDAMRRTWPRDLVPEGSVDRPAGTVIAALPRGAVVTDRHLGDLGIVGALPHDRSAVAVPVEQLPSLTAGTRVDLIGPGDDGSGALLASGASVLGSDGEVVWLAVDTDASVRVSAAVAAATLAVAVASGDVQDVHDR